MSTLYSISDQIQIFPISHTREYSNLPAGTILHNGRLLTEKNLTSISSNLAEESSFVVDVEFNDPSSANPSNIKFILGGYYIDLDLVGNKILSGTDIYAKISLNNSGYLDIEDAISNKESAWLLAKGVKFVTDDFTPIAGEYKLHLFHKGTNGVYEVPEASWYRFSTKSIQNIDGGEV